MTTFVWKMRHEASQLLGAVRTQPDLEVCAIGDSVWIRAEDASETLQQAFMELPAIHYTATDDGQLIERGKRVPQGHVPEGPWIVIAQWMPVALPVAVLAGTPARAATIEIVPGEQFETPQFLQTKLQTWTQYAVSAPRVRLDRLAFATAADGTVFIRGEPLPPISGRRFVIRGRIAIEAAWTWRPKVSAEVLEAALAIADGHLAVMYGDGNWLSLPSERFVQATRSAVRATSEEFGNDG